MPELNPEFRRNLWLELTPQRLIMLPVIVALIVTVAWLAVSKVRAGEIALAALWGLLTFWGSRLAADALVDEVTGRTWENQRMTALAPWSMTWGKLFGGTIVTWYGALWCIPAIALASDHAGDLIARAVLFGLLAQGVALLFAILVLQLHDGSIRAHVSFAQLGALLLTLGAYKIGTNGGETVTWYGFDVARDAFGYASLTAAIAWVTLGIHRSMRAEMLAPGGPALWLGFVLFAAAYAGGFSRIVDSPALILIDATQQQLMASILVLLGLSYIAAFLAPKRYARLRRLLALLRSGAWRTAWPLLPPWSVSFVFAIALTCLFPLTALATARPLESTETLAVFLVACLLFALRDLAMILMLTLDEQRGRSHVTALLYLAVLYGLLPLLLAPLGWRAALPVLVPWPAEGAALALGPAALQAVLSLWLLRLRWQRIGRTAA
jgi:hypothetical protein